MSAQNVDNRERGMSLNTRGNAEEGKAKERRKSMAPEQALDELNARIEEASTLIAPPEDRRDSEAAQHWTNGRDAAIRIIRGTE
jgi:hypothetical protein